MDYGMTRYPEEVSTRKKGDLNDNGKIDASDLLQVKSHIKKVQLLEGDDFKAADVDGNGTINASDLLKMKAHMKGVTPIWE
jgi:Ca2+-binding EF-hand superfamily protein